MAGLGSGAYADLSVEFSSYAENLYVALQGIEIFVVPLMTLALVIYGMNIMIKGAGELKKVWPIFIATPFCMTAAFYGDGVFLTKYLIPLFTDLPFQITIFVMNLSQKGSVSMSGIDSAFNALSDALNALGQATDEVDGYFLKFKVFLVVTALIIVYGFVYLIFYGTQILSMGTIYIFMSLSPIFIMAAIFPVSSGFAKAWFRELVKYALMGPLAGTVMGLTITVISGSLFDLRTRVLENPESPEVFDGSFGVAFFMAGITIMMLRQIPDWAASLTGGTQSDHSSYGVGGGAANKLSKSMGKEMSKGMSKGISKAISKMKG